MIRRLRAERLEQVGERDEARAAEQADVHGHADARAAVRLGADAEVVVRLDVDRRQRERGQRVPEPPLDLLADTLRAECVDHELHPRLDAGHAPAEVVAPGVEDRAEHRDRLVRADEHAEVARDPRDGRQPAADEHARSPARRRGCTPTSEMQLISGALQRDAHAEIEILCLRGRST